MSKYGAKKVTYDDIVFDSKMEGDYWLHLKELIESGEVLSVDPHPDFLLQEAFIKNGKRFYAIKYIADFRVTYADGRTEVVDIKGFETADFKIKRKLFEKKFPELTLLRLSYVKKYGGWVELDELKALRKANKK